MKKISIHANIASLEESAKKQFDECCAHDFVTEAALMPDAHSGYVAPIGSVIKTTGAIVPAWVGYDIGCGMIAVKISEDKKAQESIKRNAVALFKEVNRSIPMGMGGFNKAGDNIYFKAGMQNDLDKLNKLSSCNLLSGLLRQVNDRSLKNLGTLGSGNHFIEILEYKNETWLVIHSGSRGVGHTIGTCFMKLVSGLDKGFEATYAIQNEEIKKEYMIYQDYCLKFALLNRLSMAKKVEAAIFIICGVEYDTTKNLWTNKNHNHCIEVQPNVYLHRKGATSSEKGERGVIPANMKDGCFLVEGLGNADFLNSSSHGAGRALSRGQARKIISMDEFRDKMRGIVAPVNQETIDESPMAYKNIFEVMELQQASVKVLRHLKPIINWKGY
jgi:tRNA-splicing ligase RtcB